MLSTCEGDTPARFESGFLHSGDLGVKDEDGNYRITGRIKDMIIRGGENIYPREIEEFLYKLEGTSDVVVNDAVAELTVSDIKQ